MINQDMIIFKQCGYPPNDKNFIFENSEVHSNDRCVALFELNKIGIRVLQMEINKKDFIEWWLIDIPIRVYKTTV